MLKWNKALKHGYYLNTFYKQVGGQDILEFLTGCLHLLVNLEAGVLTQIYAWMSEMIKLKDKLQINISKNELFVQYCFRFSKPFW